MSARAAVGKQPSVRRRPLGRSQSLIWARSAPTARATCSAMRSATARGSSDRDSALFMSSSWRSSAARRRVSARFAAPLNAVAAWSARIVSSRRSSSSNWRRPSFDSVIDADQLAVVLHRDHEHRLVDVLGARDRRAALVDRGVVHAQRLAVERHPAREALADLRAQDLEVDLLVGADAALERDRDELVGRIEQVDAGVVVVDDASRLLDDGPADLLLGQAGAHPPRGVLRGPGAGRRGAPSRARARPDQRAGGEDRAADREVEDDHDVLERARAAADRPADDAQRQDADARDERDRVEARRAVPGSPSGRAPTARPQVGCARADAASERAAAGTSRRYRRRDDSPRAQAGRRVPEGRGFGSREPVRERAGGGVLGATAAAPPRAIGSRSPGRPSGSRPRWRGCRPRCRSTRSPSRRRGRRTRGRTTPGPTRAAGRRTTPRASPTGPASASRAGCRRRPGTPARRPRA